jgi:hypothetical protein
MRHGISLIHIRARVKEFGRPQKMEKLKYLRWLLLASVAGLLVSCSSVAPKATTSRSRFHEGASANLVLRFYSWDSIHMTRPDTRENGFLPLLDRASVTRQLGRPDLQRDLAVVVMGFMFTAAEESALFHDWKAFLVDERGFRRVVLVRASFKNEIDGLPILYDSAMAAAYDDQPKVAATIAALAATARADVADSSGNSVR